MSDENLKATPALPLKEACVRAAIDVIREDGLEKLSLRDVARRLNVSHQAPYKHFGSKDRLLVEVIRRCLRSFAEALAVSGEGQDGPDEAMRSLGEAYLTYAVKFPLEYRLMFMTPWPADAKTAGLSQDARAAFDILTHRLSALKPYVSDAERDRDAMFVWSSIHGLASILQSEAMQYLSFSEADAQAAVAHAMDMVDVALAQGRA